MNRRDRWAVAALTVVYVALAGAALLDDRYLHDEGVLTHLLASLVGRAPAATVFLQKARPPLALLYAPVAGMGLSAFLWVHVLVCAAAVPLVAMTAARLGHARPVLPAAIVALSPMHIAAGAAGLMNGDAVTGVALVAWLWAGRRWFGAGLMAGMLVWVRAELAVLAIALALWSAMRRHARVWLGLVAFGLVYGLAGALYHRDPLWMLHFPPALPAPMPGNPYWESHHGEASVAVVAAAMLAISPAFVLLPQWRWRDAKPSERFGLLAMVVLAAALVFMPRWRVFNFDLSPRYLLPVLPWFALATARVIEAVGGEETSSGPWRRVVALGAVAAVALCVDRSGGGPAMLVAVALGAFAVALGGAGRLRAAVLVVGGLVAVGPFGYADGARLARVQQASGLDQAVSRLREHPEWKPRSVFTNLGLLSTYMQRSGQLPGWRIHYLVQADQLHELTALANPNNGQREAILDALRQGFYGRPIFPEELRPEDVPVGAIFVLREDTRLPMVMPPPQWDGWLRVVHPGTPVTVSERIEAP